MDKEHKGALVIYLIDGQKIEIGYKNLQRLEEDYKTLDRAVYGTDLFVIISADTNVVDKIRILDITRYAKVFLGE